ncbi:MAG TPA: caspase family protein, partial [Blastocatellia bacterium]|nr:caspase family protein [Blastocatellia bacterium]
RIKKTGVGQVVLILDACRNDPIGRANADNPLTRAFTQGFNFDVRNREVTAFATLYATAVGARAYEYKEKKQGYFTWVLVEGLKGRAANERGEVTLASLVKYLQERVPKQVLLDLGSGKEQKPFAVIEGYRAEELVIAAPGQKLAEAADRAIVSREPVESNTGPVSQENPSDRSPTTGLEGTTWTSMSAESGEITVEFQMGGKLRYTIKTGSVGGTWKQSGSFVQIVIGNGYSVSEGNMEGGLIKLEGSNQEGKKWRWTLIPKNQ